MKKLGILLLVMFMVGCGSEVEEAVTVEEAAPAEEVTE